MHRRPIMELWMAALVSALLFFQQIGMAQDATWKPASGPLQTRWAAEVSPNNVHAEYPRPQLARDSWKNLNGLWVYAIRPRQANAPTQFDGQILVPFAAESSLSGVGKSVGIANKLWYRRTFDIPSQWSGQRILLHFGAVDWHATVWVNGRKLGEHKGGYDPFSFDMTDALNRTGIQTIVVSVWDPADKGFQPRGKQVTEPRGIWYTSVTGIWRTVWMEPVPETYIKSIRLESHADSGNVDISVELNRPLDPLQLLANIFDGDQLVAGPRSTETRFSVNIPDAKLWSPDSPFLYDLKLAVVDPATTDEAAIDSVTSYFGIRAIGIQKDENGVNRFFLNGSPQFQFGTLDQGWWPDGLYTAPTDEALKYDLEITKKLGFNMIRKHVKVEPARWYYHCDKLGLLVWQDMPNGDRHIGKNEPDIERTAESSSNYYSEWGTIMDANHNHPCIVTWVPFNEGWGQFDTDRVLLWTKRRDPARLVDGPSGWADRGTGDINDMHQYPGPAMPTPEEDRAVVLGEFGGLGLPLEGHLWWNKRNWGYRTYKTKAELHSNYDQLIERLQPLVKKGLAAAIYTQTTDVEGEVNGLMTYDREVIKFDARHMTNMHSQLYRAVRK